MLMRFTMTSAANEASDDVGMIRPNTLAGLKVYLTTHLSLRKATQIQVT